MAAMEIHSVLLVVYMQVLSSQHPEGMNNAGYPADESEQYIDKKLFGNTVFQGYCQRWKKHCQDNG
jgi:hypothetical protein